MKRIVLFLVGILYLLPVCIAGTDEAVTMVSYEQRWIDTRGTLALKNNTEEEIRNLRFQITYLDMSGNPIDYKDFEKEISIAPGMTKKLDIPSYEYDRSYHYYKSENRPGGSPAFKIKFTLKDYNFKEDEVEEIDDYTSYYSNRRTETSDFGEGYYIILAILALLLFIGISVGLYVLVAVMAKDRKRSVVVWLLLSLLATPLLMIIILLVVGKNENYINQNYDNE